MNILILSNGYGEDGVGSKLVDTINKKSKNRNNFYVMPIVGSGDIYKKNDNVNLLACNKVFKCSGFLRSFKYLLNDIKNGLIGYHLKQIRELQKLNKKIKFDEITAVGDFFLVLISLFISKRRIYFLPTAKSDYFQKHLWIEKIIMKMKCKKVFPRDELTHNSFKNYGISSQYLGNVLMDTIEDENDDKINFSNEEYKILILPGSREEVYENLKIIKNIIKEFNIIAEGKSKKVSYYISLHNSLHESKVYEIYGDVKVTVLKGKFKTLVENADIVLGLSGSANEQALGMGKPVVAFDGYEPNITKKRFLEQKKLLGDGLIYVEGNPSKIANVIYNVLNNNNYLAEIKEKAKIFMGTTGAINKIAEIILNENI